MSTSTLHFHGGAGTVTGSNFLLDTGGAKFLIDCGLFQGAHTCEEGNWTDFAYDVKEISHLFITHAHIDHIGRIPHLVKQGFRGKIVSTHATKALSGPLLLDAMELIERDAQRCGKEMLYGEADVQRALSLWEVVSYHEPLTLPDGVVVEFLDAGHILGSAMVKFSRGEKSLVITGDLGGGNSPLLGPVEELEGVDYVVMESVYGDRVRPQDDQRREHLEDIIEDTVGRGGTLLIPAFSTERTQDLLYEIRDLMTSHRIPSVPVFLDSPLALEITRAFLAHPEYFAPDIRKRIESGEDIFAFPELRFVEKMSESRRISETPSPKIIIAGSGMSNGGRVIFHERDVLPDPASTLLIVGYQAAGSPGRRLLEGTKKLQLSRESIPVRCKVESLFGYSAHMDGEALLEFANQASRSATEIFLAQGEPSATAFMAQRIRDYLSVRATIPEAGDTATLEL